MEIKKERLEKQIALKQKSIQKTKDEIADCFIQRDLIILQGKKHVKTEEPHKEHKLLRHKINILFQRVIKDERFVERNNIKTQIDLTLKRLRELMRFESRNALRQMSPKRTNSPAFTFQDRSQEQSKKLTLNLINTTRQKTDENETKHKKPESNSQKEHSGYKSRKGWLKGIKNIFRSKKHRITVN